MKSRNSSFRLFLVEQLERRQLLASDFLLEIEGIKGESTDAKHLGAIELESFSWGASNAARSGPADPLTTEDFRFVTTISKASPQLYASTTGKHFPLATLFVRKKGTEQHEYLKIKMTDVLVSSIQSRSLNEELPKEEVSLSFSSIHQELIPTNPDGTFGKPITTSWTIDRTRQRKPSSSSLLRVEPSSNLDASDIYMKFGDIKGEATEAKHKDWIQIESWSFGASNPSTTAGSGGSVGKVNFQDLHFVSRVSKASPLLLRGAAIGEHYKEAIFDLRRAAAPNSNEFLKVKFTDLLVSSYQVIGSTETETLEEVTLSFKSMTQTYSGADKPIVTSLIAANDNGAQTSSENLLEKTIPAAQASDIFLQLDGIEGESTDAKHKGSVQIHAFSWGLSNAGSTKVGGGGGAGKVNVQDLSFTSSVNKATPELIRLASKGEHFKTATLSVRKAGGKLEDYLAIELENTLVSSYQVSGHGGGHGQPTESISLNFTKIKYDYNSQQAVGIASPVTFSWAIPPSAKSVATQVPPPVVEPTLASVDYYLKIGDIKGESTDSKHKGEIEILSWSWGVSQQGSTVSGGGGRAGKASFQDFHFVAESSSASPQILDAFASQSSSRRHEKVVFYGRRTGETADYLEIELTDSLISSIQTRSLDNSAPLEEVSFNFTKIDWAYRRSSNNAGLPPEVTSRSIAVRPKDERSRGESMLDETQVQAATHDIFLEIEGIKGELQNVKHKIDVSSFSFGASQTGAYGGGGGASKVVLQDFHFVKTTDPASAELLRALALGKHFDWVTLTSRQRDGGGGDPDFDLLTYKFSDLLISSYSTRGEGTRPMEDFSLNFTRLDMRDLNQDSTPDIVTGTLDTSGLPFEHDPGKHLLDQTTPSTVAADYFLKLDGIKGESTDAKHKEWILIDSFSWGADREIVLDEQGDKVPGRFALRDFSFVGKYDKASPQLFTSISGGTPLSNGVLDIVLDRQRQSVYSYKLQDVIVSSYGFAGNNPGIPTTDLTLTPASVDASFQSSPVVSASAIEFAAFSYFSFDRDDEEERLAEGQIVDTTAVDLHFSLINEI